MMAAQTNDTDTQAALIATLTGDARACADAVAKQFPSVKFTSGRRTISEQALAMAKNVCKDRDRLRKLAPHVPRPSKWIVQTYSNARIANECQDWVDRNPDAAESGMANKFCVIISMFDDDEKRRLSRHLTGDAFDVQPIIGGDGEAVLDALKDWAVRKGGRFLSSEGGLVVWHWQAK